ncbi:YcxB family protein [Lutispora thermophila]|uniref:YcxB-like protein n=1 Tax=Lutispora thermophila DSM 19022 TaxID=1122184 RepID=A0A1M6BD56_9FIRM|nr:YcxB family protein [Lutispora thermophila]SHI46684.1 YcxB-like protein [Lutispora thermophila DSM 19022]
MEEPKIIVNTIMTKEDYRKFLYTATFRRSKLIIPMLCLISLIGSILINFRNNGINLIYTLLCWVFLLALSIIVVAFRVERKNAQRIKTDKTGAFDSVNTLKFYDDKIAMENEALKSTGELKYEQFYAVMESKDYFIFYLNVNQASLIRKKDIDNLKEFREFIVCKFRGKYKEI